MYKKILVPLDGSAEAEGVLPLIKDEVAPEGEGILLHILPPFKSQNVGDQVVLGTQLEESERAKSLGYLKRIASQLGDGSERWHCEVVVANSVAEGIIDFATREEVDHIAMYTHDRKGLAKLIKGSIAEKVQKKAPIEVQVFKPRELETPLSNAG